MVLVGDPMQSMGRGSASHEGKPHCYSAWLHLLRQAAISIEHHLKPGLFNQF